jgi:hypothetical protein
VGDDVEESSTDDAAHQAQTINAPAAQGTLLERARAASEAGHPILTIVVF